MMKIKNLLIAGLMIALSALDLAAEEELRIVDDRPSLSVDWKAVLKQKSGTRRQIMLLEDGRAIWYCTQPGTENGYLVYFDDEGRAAKEVLVSLKRQTVELTAEMLKSLGRGHVFYSQRDRLLAKAQAGEKVTQSIVASVKALAGQSVVGVHQTFMHSISGQQEQDDLSLDAVTHAVVIYDLEGRRVWGFSDRDIGTVLGVSANGRYFAYSTENSGDLVAVRRPGTKIQGWSRKRGTFFDYRFTDNERYLLLIAQSTGAADVFDLEKKAFVVPEGRDQLRVQGDVYQVAGAGGTVRIVRPDTRQKKRANLVAGGPARQTAQPETAAGAQAYPGWWLPVFLLFLAGLLALRFRLKRRPACAAGEALPKRRRTAPKTDPDRQPDLFNPPADDPKS